MDKDRFIEEADLDACWVYYKSYLVDILNKEYDLDEAISDLKGLIDSPFDKRVSTRKLTKNEE